MVADPFRVHLTEGVWRRAVCASLGIGLGVGVLLHDQIRQPYAVPDLGDPLFSMWRIGWVNHQLATDPAHLFDANIFYPERLTLTLSDPMILPALMAAPLAALGVHPVVVYNLLLLSGFWLSGIATYLLVERLTGSARGAFIAGLMYACYSFRLEHYSHLELQMTQWMPLGLIALHLLFATGRPRYAIALALAGVAQLYSSMYYAVFFLVYAAVIGAGLFAIHRPALGRLMVALVAGGIVAALLAQPLVRPFVEAAPLKGDRSIEEIKSYSAAPFDYLRTHVRSATWRDRMPPPAAERALFPGLAPLVLATIGVAPPFSAIRIVYAAGLLVCYDASLGFGGWVYPSLHKWLAPVRGLRVPARFGILVGLTLAILAGFGARRVLQRCRRKTAGWLAVAGMATVILIDAWPALALVPVWKAPPPIYGFLPANQDVVLAEFPVLDDPVLNMPFMYFSLWHWRPMVNGYSGFLPVLYLRLIPDFVEFPRGNSPAVLRRLGVTHVIINCGLRYAPCEETRTLMRQSADLRIVREERWEDEQVELFELVR